jgi:hypothetical protein
MIYRTLEDDRINDPDIVRLRGVYRHSWVRNQGLLARLGDALHSLNRRGIPTMVLNGAAVTVTHYRDPGARRLDDVGVLVPPHQTGHALRILRADGWSPLPRLDPLRGLRARHAIALAGPSDAKISLRCRTLPGSVGDEVLWSGAVPASVGGTATLAPGPTDQLLHACAPGVRALPNALMWIIDAAVILRSAGSEIDWARLAGGIARRRTALTTTTSLAVVRAVLDAPIPHEVMTELGQLATTARVQRPFSGLIA